MPLSLHLLSTVISVSFSLETSASFFNNGVFLSLVRRNADVFCAELRLGVSQIWSSISDLYFWCWWSLDLAMNRSFRAQESQMSATVRQRQQQVGSLRSSVMKEKDEELALFLEMRKREKERSHLLLLQDSEEFDAPLGAKPGSSPIFNIAPSPPPRKTVADDFLNSDNDKNDYDWLLTPPGTPLFPSLEMESQKTVMSRIGTPKARPTALKSRLANPQPEPAARSSLVSKHPASSPGLNSSSAGIRRPSSSGGPGSRPATPTGRPTLTATTRPSRPATPTSRATLTSTKPTVPARSSTPVTRSTARSSTPTSRPSIPASKPVSRAATPTRRPSAPSSVSNLSAPPIKSTSSVTKSGPTTSRNPVPSRGSSPTVKSRPWKPSEMPGYSLDAPPNLRTSAPERPVSASRVGLVHLLLDLLLLMLLLMEGQGGNHALQQEVVLPMALFIPVEAQFLQVINMRKLVPPKQEDKHSPRGNLSGKLASSPDSSGFGRTLSKKSLDMAIRHMDIRRSIPGNLRPLMTNIPASSMYSVRSGPTRSRTVSVSDSPLATSSNASSEVSVNNNALCVDGGEIEDDIGSERGGRPSPASLRGR
ncbi:hypothetical protein CK203_097290 [Vitis vinifera]|uniref:Uncharacterized protein n=1 Tax=Vitis vinifera TaxID=29760 RepID=A0A438D5B3_VITVI|nr:hypothetical protein CK203_097290 [Vitis vinifera]